MPRRNIPEDVLEELAVAMIAQAAEDYREYRAILKVKPHSCYWHKKLEEVEEFFLTGCFEYLTEEQGEKLLQRLREEWE